MQFTAQAPRGPPTFHSSPASPEVSQAQLQLLPGFVSGDIVGGRATFVLGEEKTILYDQ